MFSSSISIISIKQVKQEASGFVWLVKEIVTKLHVKIMSHINICKFKMRHPK
jgi:hypothetical protein